MRNNKVNRFGDAITQTKIYDFAAIELARTIIEKNPTDHWLISALAGKAGINENKLKKGFKELYRTSPYKYLVRLRLEKAKTMLEDTDHTIREIADSVGFETYQGFSSAFRNAFGVLPTLYRKQLESMYIGINSTLAAS